jgi:hypothetical protein
MIHSFGLDFPTGLADFYSGQPLKILVFSKFPWYKDCTRILYWLSISRLPTCHLLVGAVGFDRFQCGPVYSRTLDFVSPFQWLSGGVASWNGRNLC